jgi:hypothetical protein
MGTFFAFIIVNLLLWSVIAYEAGRHNGTESGEPYRPAAHTTRGPLR